MPNQQPKSFSISTWFKSESVLIFIIEVISHNEIDAVIVNFQAVIQTSIIM
ncbi:MAG: hypothetical protein J6583_13435 [Gilliamella sp.]|uniref:hypothetical protein n=1 Tax=Gilliamella sp. Occ4-3 TaxID=3120254 RepID=UPI0015CF27DB|nr:hypothetical protein [Gilliamella apicola]MCO6548755.1 hypothetical protein [Gilliamella sp.]